MSLPHVHTLRSKTCPSNTTRYAQVLQQTSQLFQGKLQATTLCVFMHGPLTGYFATGLPQLLQLVSVLQQQL